MTTHYQLAVKALERADYISDADNWGDGRHEDVIRQIAEAQVHATLALADALISATGMNIADTIHHLARQ